MIEKGERLTVYNIQVYEGFGEASREKKHEIEHEIEKLLGDVR